MRRKKKTAKKLRLKEGTVEGRERGASDLPRGGGFTRSIGRKSRQEGLGRVVQLGRCYDCLAMGNKSMGREAGEEDVSRGGRRVEVEVLAVVGGRWWLRLCFLPKVSDEESIPCQVLLVPTNTVPCCAATR